MGKELNTKRLANTTFWLKPWLKLISFGSNFFHLAKVLATTNSEPGYALNQLGKSDKRRGLQSILSLFHKELNKFNNTEALMLDSIYHTTLKLLKNHIFGRKTSGFCHLLSNVIMDVITLRYLSVNHLWFIDFNAWWYITHGGNVM